jgi:putative SOS response-associated peptidase YedK
MCAQFTPIRDLKALAKRFHFIIKMEGVVKPRCVPGYQAPVMTNHGSQRTLESMRFGLVPSWSKEPRVKFSTYNARLMSPDSKTGKEVPIYEKPTWRSAFRSRHCLVPMETFIEPLYSGKYAGNMVAFGREDADALLAAGIWEEWADKSTGEVIPSFSILTDDPIPFVERLGHDRTPVFLKEEAFEEWLSPQKEDPQGFVTFLRQNKAFPPLTVAIDRPLATGWEKKFN